MVRHTIKQHVLQADVFQLMHTALEEKRKDILPPGGKCLWSARKSKRVTELGTDRSGQPPGTMWSLRKYDCSNKHWIPFAWHTWGHPTGAASEYQLNERMNPTRSVLCKYSCRCVRRCHVPFLSFRTASMRCWEDNSQMRRVLSSLTVAQMGRRGWAASPHTSPSMCPCGEEMGQQLGLCVLARSLAASCCICSPSVFQTGSSTNKHS